jgi:hypothetical protein
MLLAQIIAQAQGGVNYALAPQSLGGLESAWSALTKAFFRDIVSMSLRPIHHLVSATEPVRLGTWRKGGGVSDD